MGLNASCKCDSFQVLGKCQIFEELINKITFINSNLKHIMHALEMLLAQLSQKLKDEVL